MSVFITKFSRGVILGNEVTGSEGGAKEGPTGSTSDQGKILVAMRLA